MLKQTRINWEKKVKHPIKGRLPDEVLPSLIGHLASVDVKHQES